MYSTTIFIFYLKLTAACVCARWFTHNSINNCLNTQALVCNHYRVKIISHWKHSIFFVLFFSQLNRKKSPNSVIFGSLYFIFFNLLASVFQSNYNLWCWFTNVEINKYCPQLFAYLTWFIFLNFHFQSFIVAQNSYSNEMR